MATEKLQPRLLVLPSAWTGWVVTSQAEEAVDKELILAVFKVFMAQVLFK